MESADTRTLVLEIPPCQLAKNAPDPVWTNLQAMNGWQFTVPGQLVIHWMGTIDLSGYVREMKTFYPSAGMIQQGPFTLEQGGEGSITYTLVSSIPIEPENVFHQLLSMSGGPGFLNTAFYAALGSGDNQQNWDTVMFAESQVNVPNTNISPNTLGIQQRLEVNQSGSLSPTAADTLYVMRIVIPLGVTQTAMQIPASRVILPGKFGIEPDVEYMMRLKRSVELSQQV